MALLLNGSMAQLLNGSIYLNSKILFLDYFTYFDNELLFIKESFSTNG
jgi:hypothetical protein